MDGRIGECAQEFRNESGRSMMRFIFRDESRLSGYQLEMLKNNRIPMLLRSEIMKVDNETRISYDITSMIPLRKILERKEIGRREFFRCLEQVAGVFDQLENHLLDFGGLMLDSGMIYGSPADDRLFFVYLPIEGLEQDVSESLRCFLTNLIMKETRFRNENADNYVQRLIELIKSPDFSLNALKLWLEGFAGGRDEGRPVKAEPQPSAEPAVPVRARHDLPALSPIHSRQKKPVVREEQTRTATGKKTTYPLSSWLFLGSAIAAILALFAAMAMKGAFEPGNPDMLTTLVGLVLISAAVIWLVVSKAFSKERKVERTVVRKVRVTEGMARDTCRKVEYVNKSIPLPGAKMPGNRIQGGFAESENRPAGNMGKGNDGCSSGHAEAACADDRTVLLARTVGSVPSIRRLGGNGEAVMIRQWPYRIGRMAGQVDYCVDNPAVGRIHAELTMGPDGYLITDMNTRNGTYVNGIRIEPNTEYPIKSGDRFMLANEEFQFFG